MNLEWNVLRYDINKDGSFNINDCTLIQKYISDLAVLDEQQIKIADVNNDGRVSIINATSELENFFEFILVNFFNILQQMDIVMLK